MTMAGIFRKVTPAPLTTPMTTHTSMMKPKVVQVFSALPLIIWAARTLDSRITYRRLRSIPPVRMIRVWPIQAMPRKAICLMME